MRSRAISREESASTVKLVTQPAGYTGFMGLRVRVKLVGVLCSKADDRKFFKYWHWPCACDLQK